MSGYAGTSKLTYHAKVPQARFTGLIWGAAAVTLLFLILRAVIRLKVFHRLFADDAFVLLAWLLHFANVVLDQEMTKTIYLTINVYAGLEAPSANFLQTVLTFLHAELAVNLLFLLSIWSIKISFLLFFRKLGHHVKRWNTLWWLVLWGTLAGLAICVGTSCVTPATLKRTERSVQITTTFDIITDVMILALPINLLWNVQISIRRKLALVGIFSLTVFTMAVSLARALVLLKLARSNQVDPSFSFTWFVVEEAVSIIIVCVGSYRALFTREASSRRLAPAPSKKVLVDSDERRGAMPMKNFNSVTVINGRSLGTLDSLPTSSTERILPVGAVHVRQEYSVNHDAEADCERALWTQLQNQGSAC